MPPRRSDGPSSSRTGGAPSPQRDYKAVACLPGPASDPGETDKDAGGTRSPRALEAARNGYVMGQIASAPPEEHEVTASS